MPKYELFLKLMQLFQPDFGYDVNTGLILK
jgi:hypothetical protein